MASIEIFKPIEIMLDKPRRLRPTHRALFEAEQKINELRHATPATACSIDYLIVKAYNDTLAGTGTYPLDLTVVLLWAFLLPDDPKLTTDRVMAAMDATELTRGQINDALWRAYIAVAGKNITSAPAPEEDKKKDPSQQTGSDFGALPDSNLN